MIIFFDKLLTVLMSPDWTKPNSTVVKMKKMISKLEIFLDKTFLYLRYSKIDSAEKKLMTEIAD